MRRKETLRGVGDQPRPIDDTRRRRAGVMQTRADLGKELTVDSGGRLRVNPEQVVLADSAKLEALVKKVEDIQKALDEGA